MASPSFRAIGLHARPVRQRTHDELTDETLSGDPGGDGKTLPATDFASDQIEAVAFTGLR
jgi:hypothetical protein